MISPFNDEQAKAIALRGVSILVSAPAGSGKTKILVSRIMSLLMDDHYSIDEFLVLTFTQAAAAEMKQRLLFAIEDELKKDLDVSMRAHLLTQKEKIPYAYITNFHGFCSQLLKKYGYLVGVEPGFEILSETTLLKHTVLDECIEQWMEDNEFQSFISLYFNDMHFDRFKSLLLELYEMIHSIDDVDGFIRHIKEDIYLDYIESDKALNGWGLFNEIKRQLKNAAIMGYNRLIELGDYASEKGIQDFFTRPDEQSKANQALPIPFDTMYDYFDHRLKMLESDWGVDFYAYHTFKNLSLTNCEKTYTIKWEEDIKPYQKEFTAKKTAALKPYLEKAKTYLIEDEDSFKLMLKESMYVIDTLLGKKGLVHSFKQAYQEKKKAMHVLDFNDLEQFTITLLQPENHISELLYMKLKEIMIDEYQDTNQIQETIISLIKDYQQPSTITFMVGDMKQSIYRFRQADPQLFKEKYDTYSTNDEDALKTGTRRIDLQFNYRSNKIVLDSVNYIFDQIMDTSVGGLEYLHDDSSQLNYDYLRKEGCRTIEELPAKKIEVDARYENEQRFDSEVLLIDETSVQNLKATEYEAHMVALKILEMIENSTLNDFKGNHRPIQYKDIVVLMRSTSLFLTFKKVFDHYHIPNHIVLSQGYLNAVEIMSTITMLKAIINPYDDICFLSLLRGNYLFSHFSDDLIIQIKLLDKNQSIYDNLISLIETSQIDDPLLKQFIDVYQELRTQLFQMLPSEFVKFVLEKSGYRLFASQLINGDQRKANIDLLVEEFMQLEQDKNIFEIVDYYEELMKHQTSSSPAQMISSSDNVVQFMTIHKSKGLEFPIVFVSNCDKGFNKQDSTKRMIIDKQLGIAIKPRTKKTIPILDGEFVDQIVEYENAYRQLLAAKQTEESINEEMRIFYVALTRASQKLIMTGIGTTDDVMKWQEQILHNASPDIYDGQKNKHQLIYYNARKANSYLDWIGLSLMRHPNIIKDDMLHQANPEIAKNFETIARINKQALFTFENTKAAKFQLKFIDASHIDAHIHHLEPKSIAIKQTQRIDIEPLPPISSLPITTSVTKLQADASKHEFSNQIKVSLQQSPMGAAQKGTLVHAFFEYLPLDGTSIEQVIEQLYQKGLYNDQEKEVLLDYRDKIEVFLTSESAQRMKNAKQLYREKAFSLIDETTHQIVHGIFDVLCIEDQRITIIDYKTDRVKKETKEHVLIENHRVQMEYYKLLLSRLYPDHCIEAMVYYLEIGKYVII